MDSMLEIRRKHIEPDVFVLQPVGRITMGKPCQEVEWIVDELIRGNIRKLVLDLSEVDRVDSTGLGMIVTSSGKFKKAGGEMRIAGVKGMVHEMLYTANIHRVIGFHDTLDEAVAAFVAKTGAS
jgi:anti-sigma B factor antagonist